MKVLLVDDEALARERLLRLLQKVRPRAECTQAADGSEALAQVAQYSPDLVLLDIAMPGVDGIEVAAALDELDNPPAVIFCTAYDAYALQALQHQAVAYLLKPVREAELVRALELAGRVNRVQLATLRHEAGADARARVSQLSRDGMNSLPLAEVRCFLAEDKYVTACSPEGELLLSESLIELEREYGDNFIRVHRNALVALAHVTRLRRDDGGGWYVELDGVARRPQVSRRHLRSVREKLASR